MFRKQVEQLLLDCREELLQTSNKNIKKAVETIKQNLPEDYEGFLDTMIRNVISESILMDIPDDVEDEVFEEFIEKTSKDVLKLRTVCIFDVALDGHEKELYRRIQIPYIDTLADLAYAILVAFEALGNHLFQITYKRKQYYCDTYVDLAGELCASLEDLEELNLKPGTKLTMHYDFGDDYVFKINFVKTELCNNIEEAQKKKVLRGAGYGIWDDAHYEMDLYYEDPKKFEAFLKEQGIDKDLYPLDEEFDLEDMNEDFDEDCLEVKSMYEDDMDEEYDEMEMMEYLS